MRVTEETDLGPGDAASRRSFLSSCSKLGSLGLPFLIEPLRPFLLLLDGIELKGCDRIRLDRSELPSATPKPCSTAGSAHISEDAAMENELLHNVSRLSRFQYISSTCTYNDILLPVNCSNRFCIGDRTPHAALTKMHAFSAPSPPCNTYMFRDIACCY
jgi:hypothetical protein